MSRTYSREEIAALMARAAEIQQQRPVGDADGLTLAELEEVARSAGISPDALRSAASELEPRRTAPPAESDTQAFAERFVRLELTDGELPPAVVEEVAVELRHRFETTHHPIVRALGFGKTRQERVGRTVEWRYTDTSDVSTFVQLRPRAGGVALRMNQTVGWAAPGAEAATYGFAAALVPTLAALAAVRVPLVVVATFGVAWLVLTLLIRQWIRATRSRKERQLGALADRLAALVAEAAPRLAKPEQTARPDGRPLLDDLDPEADASQHRPNGARTRS